MALLRPVSCYAALRTWIFILGLPWLASSSTLMAQSDLSSLEIDRFGFDGFQLLLQQHGIRTISGRFDSALSSPKKTIIFIFGDTRRLIPMRQQLIRYFNKGGALLVATDTTDARLLKAFRLGITKNQARFHRRNWYRGMNDCPVVRCKRQRARHPAKRFGDHYKSAWLHLPL